MNYRSDYLQSSHWRRLRKSKLESVGAACNICNHVDSSNDVHHIHYRKIFDVGLSDLVVLCRACHKKVHFLLKLCRTINSHQDSAKRWRTTLYKLSVRLRVEAEQHAAQRRKSAAIRTFRDAEKRLGLNRPFRFKNLYKFHKLNPNPSDQDWIAFAGVKSVRAVAENRDLSAQSA